MSFYYKLFKAGKAGKKEDCLTEAFADLLRHLDEDARRQVLELFLNKPESTLVCEYATQYPIKVEVGKNLAKEKPKYPDLVLLKDDKPFAIIEVKLDADFTDSQLENYAKFLKDEYPEGYLCLLTAWRAAPPGFEGKAENEFDTGEHSRKVVYWYQVSSVLRDVVKKDNGNRSRIMDTLELMEYLGVDAKMPEANDIENLGNYLRLWSQKRVKSLFDNVCNELSCTGHIVYDRNAIYVGLKKSKTTFGIYFSTKDDIYGFCDVYGIDENEDCMFVNHYYENIKEASQYAKEYKGLNPEKGWRLPCPKYEYDVNAPAVAIKSIDYKNFVADEYKQWIVDRIKELGEIEGRISKSNDENSPKEDNVCDS